MEDTCHLWICLPAYSAWSMLLHYSERLGLKGSVAWPVSPFLSRNRSHLPMIVSIALKFVFAMANSSCDVFTHCDSVRKYLSERRRTQTGACLLGPCASTTTWRKWLLDDCANCTCGFSHFRKRNKCHFGIKSVDAVEGYQFVCDYISYLSFTYLSLWKLPVVHLYDKFQ